MKFKIIFPLFFLCCFTQVFSALKKEGFTLTPIVKFDSNVLEKISKKDLSDKDVQKELEKLISNSQDEKSIQADVGILSSNDIQFNKTAFGGNNYFYLGAASSRVYGINSSTLVKAFISQGETSFDENVIGLFPLAPPEVNVNGEIVKEDKNQPYLLVANPIYNKKVENLALVGKTPILTVSSSPVDPEKDNKYVYLISDIQAGSFIQTYTGQINDAGGNPTSGIVGLSACGNNICVAVKPQDVSKSFGWENSGFAILTQDKQRLQPINAVTGDKAGNLALKLDLNAEKMLAIEQAVKIAGLGDMYWDSTLQRLFVTFADVERVSVTAKGGGVSILVGRLTEKNVLSLEPVVGLNKNLFTANDEKFIIGFYSDNTVTYSASCYKVRTMFTSTGKQYLIVNGSVSANIQKNTIYALPIIKEKKESAGVNDSDIGKIANKNDFSVLPSNSADMSLNTEKAVVVGGLGKNPLIRNDQNIQDMFVVGDSVFICVAQNRVTADQEAGIFQSSAIFDKDGKIIAWTPFRRVMGSIDRVYGAGLDQYGNYWYLSDEEYVKNIVKVTQWGQSAEQPGLIGNGLVDLLGEEFKRENAGVHQIFNFDKETPSLARYDTANQISFMIATGLEQVALIKTGEGNTDKPFTPTQDVFTKDASGKNVYFWQGDALVEVGPICCVEVSRIVNEDSGWLFVGGHDGVAVLRSDDGTGWDGRVGAAKINLDEVAKFSFKLLKKSDEESFFQVRKLVCDGAGEFLYIMTADKLYRVKMVKNKFADVSAALEEKEIKNFTGTLLDMLIINRQDDGVKLLVAATSGLFISDLINDVDEDKLPTWNPVLLNSTIPLNTPVAHLYFESLLDGGLTTAGNLYALSADFSLNLASIYRFNVQDGLIEAIKEPAGTDSFYGMGELRSNVVTDGAYGYNLLSKQFGQIDFLRKINMIGDQYSKRASELSLDLDVDEEAYNVGLLVKNSASGAWIVPCDQGIRGND